MKKRRELDALVNGKIGRRKKHGEHELLRNDSESSEIEEFSIGLPQKSVVRKRQTSRVCATCLVVCGFLLLVACIVAVAGLVWVHIKLQQDVDLIKETLLKVESGSRGTPLAFQDMHTKLHNLQQTVDELKDSKQELEDVKTRLDVAEVKIKNLETSTENIKKDVANAPALSGLKEKVEANMQSFADYASDLKSVQDDVESLKKDKKSWEEQVKKIQEELGSNMEDSTEELEGGRSLQNDGDTNLPAMQPDFQQWMTSITDMNRTTLETMSQHKSQLELLSNKTQRLDSRLQIVELQAVASQANSNNTKVTSVAASLPDMQEFVQEAVSTVLDELKNVTQGERQQVDEVLLGNLTHRLSVVEQNLDWLDDLQKSKNITTSSSNDTKVTELSIQLDDLRDMFDKYKQQNNELLQSVNDTAWRAHDHTSQVETQVNILSSKILALEKSSSNEVTHATQEQPSTSENQHTTLLSEENSQTTSANIDISEEELIVEEDPGEKEMPTVSIEDINSPKDLIKAFARWDKNGDEKVAYEDMITFVGSSNMPDQSVLNAYDANHDGYFSRQEMLKAFGFKEDSLPFSDSSQKKRSIHHQQFEQVGTEELRDLLDLN